MLHLDGDDEPAWELLTRFKQSDERPEPIRVLAVARPEDRDKALALGADECVPAVPGRDELLDMLRKLGGAACARRILVIDDDDVARYLIKTFLRGTACVVSEASSGRDGLEAARVQRPDAIFCDVFMRDMSGLDVLAKLKADPATRDIPVVLNTAKSLSAEERADLKRLGVPVLCKDRFSRADAAAAIRRILIQIGIET